MTTCRDGEDVVSGSAGDEGGGEWWGEDKSVPGCSKNYETQVFLNQVLGPGLRALHREEREEEGPEFRRSPAHSSSHDMDIDLSQPDEGPLPMEGIENLPFQGPPGALDTLPQPLEGPPPANDSLERDEPGPARRVTLFLRERFETAANGFRLFRSYLYRPTHDPDSLIALDDLSNRFTPPDSDPPQSNPTPPAHPKGLNTSASMVVAWQNNGNTNKSDGEVTLSLPGHSIPQRLQT
ncbi:hypothetical protein B0H14DRAFT_3725712 [Mycena olivaceomarginata]|nr:hypothetical protein B0H14DRAFT_3725712 [Mycena olivaceomarginata]